MFKNSNKFVLGTFPIPGVAPDIIKKDALFSLC